VAAKPPTPNANGARRSFPVLPDHTVPMAPEAPESTDGPDTRAVLRPDWSRPAVRRASIGLVFVVCVFVVVPIVAMLTAAG
jgi:hypothetical protein